MKTSAGFTLIEILIAMLVLAVGLLGLAGLQASSLKNNQSAYNRSQATQLAYDLADRMRANVSAGPLGLDPYTAILPSAAVAQPSCLTVSTTCTSALMAQSDLFEWNSAVNAVLPSGAGTITVESTPSSKIFNITIAWDDDRDGDDSNNLVFQTSFQCQLNPSTNRWNC